MKMLGWSFILSPLLIGGIIMPFAWLSLANETDENTYRLTGIFGIVTLIAAIISLPFLFASAYKIFTNGYSTDVAAEMGISLVFLIISSISGIIYAIFIIISLFKISEVYDVQNLKNLAIALIVSLVLTIIPFIGFLAAIALLVIYILIGIQILNIKEAS